MTRLLLALLLVVAAPSWAATYWVAPDSASGLGAGSPYMNGSDSALTAFPNGPKTLAWFNLNAEPGDTCRFKSGDYGTAAINPEQRNATATSRVRYLGFPQDPSAVRVYNIQIGEDAGRWGSYITVKWVTTTNAFTGIKGWEQGGVVPSGSEIVNCRSSVANDVAIEGNGCLLDSLVLTGSRDFTGPGGSWLSILGSYGCDNPNTRPEVETCKWTQPFTSFEPISGNRVTNCTFNVTMSESGSAKGIMMFRMVLADSTLIYNNTFNCTVGETDGYFFGMEFYNCDFANVQDNTWNFTFNNTPAGSRGLWGIRDLSYRNRFFRNTVTATGSNCSFMLTNSGSYPAGTGRNYFGYNTLKVASPQPETGVLFFQDGSRTDTLEFNTVATSSTLPALYMQSNTDRSGMLVRNNTFFTAGPTAVQMNSQAALTVPATKLVDNVYYCQSANTSTENTVEVYGDVDVDSAGVFFALGAAEAQHALGIEVSPGVPGSGGSYGGTLSRWCSPMLADSAYATLNGRVTLAGCAVGSEWPGGFAGIGVSDADVTAPAVSLTFPADTSYTWTGGETMPLTWTASDAVGISAIVIQYGSTPVPNTEPTSWSTVTTLAGNATSYNWVMAGVSQSYGFVRVRAVDAAGNIGSDSQVYKTFRTEQNNPGTQEIDP